MSGFLKTLGSFIASSPPKTTAEPEEPQVEIDQIPPQEIVVKDCDTCVEECDEHSQYPSYLDFDNKSPLLGSMSPYGRHFMISTAQSDWPERIEEDYGTLAANLQALLVAQPMSWRTFVTNTSLIPQYGTTASCSLDVVILPDNIIVGNVTPDDAQLLYDVFVKMPLPTEPVDITKFKDIGELGVYPNPFENMILICSHRKRDKRCGVTAPILAREFDHVLRELDIHDGEGGTSVSMVSHVGGKAYSVYLFKLGKKKKVIWLFI